MPTPRIEGLEAELESLERIYDEALKEGDTKKAEVYAEKIRRVKIELDNLGFYDK